MAVQKFIHIALLSTLLFSNHSFSGVVPPVVLPKVVSKCFSESFGRYVSNRCHANALHFLLNLRRHHFDLVPMAYWSIMPFQGGHFSMINVYSAVRDSQPSYEREPPYDWMPTENWYSHGIVVYQLGDDQIVFDSDYQNVPTPVVLSEWARNLFYAKPNDQVLKADVFNAPRLITQIDCEYQKRLGNPKAIVDEPELAYETNIWNGIGQPIDVHYIRNHD